MFKNLEFADRETLDIFRRMAIVAEYQNPDIKNHLERIKGFTYILAKNMDISLPNAEGLGIASMLHDIGKVGLPPEISQNSDKFSAKDYETVKKHVIIGADILNGSPSSMVQTAQTITLTHHERWNGSGYPDGLRGTEIPLGGRIVAVADVFDALTTFRSYKTPVDVNKALALIRDSAGTLFDPEVVGVFASRFSDILNLRQNFI